MRKNIVTLLFIVFIALTLRVPAMYLQSMTGDEASTVFQADFPFFDMIERLSVTDIADADIAPPLYFILLNLYIRHVDFSVVGARSLSLLFDILTIIAIFLLLQRVIDWKTASLASFLVALSPFHVWYAAEIRMYAIVPFFAVISTMSLLMIERSSEDSTVLAGSKRRWWFLLFWLSATLGLYTQYYSALLLAAQAIIGMLVLRGRMRFLFFACLAAVGVAFLPWVPSLLTDLRVLSTNPLYAGPPGFIILPYVLVKLVLFGNSAYIATYAFFYAIGLLLLATVMVLLVLNVKILERPVLIIGGIVLTAVVMLTGAAFISPQSLRPHATIVLLPLVIVVCARVLVVSGRFTTFVRYSLMAFWCGTLVLYNYNPSFSKPKTREAATFLCQHAAESEPIVNLPLAIPVPDNVLPGSFQVLDHYVRQCRPLFFLHGDDSDELLARFWQILGERSSFLLLRYEYREEPLHYREFEQAIKSSGFEGRLMASFPSKVDGFGLTITRYSSRRADRNENSEISVSSGNLL